MSNDFKKTMKKDVSMERKKEIWAYIFIVGPLLYFFAFRIFPTMMSFYLSITSWDLLSSNKPFAGLRNFIFVLKDPVFRIALTNTLKYLVIAVPICLVISLGVALVLNSIVKGKGIFRMLVFIPYITSTVAISWVWKWMFMKNGGVINTILLSLGLKAQPFLSSTDQAIYVIISNIVWKQIGFNTIIFVAGLMQISKTYYEAAEIDGASSWQQFKNITIPLLNPTLVYLAVINTISTLQVFTQIFNIAGPEGGPLNSTTSIVVEIYKTAFMSYKMGRASAMTVILFVIILGITLFQMKIINKEK